MDFREIMELKKVSMSLSIKSIDNVNELSSLLRENNRTRVVSTALEIAKIILKQVKSGKHIIVRDENDKEQELTFV